MTAMRCVSRWRRLPLLARAAALRLAGRSASRDDGRVRWRPVALRWRQRPRQARPIGHRGAVMPRHTSWHSHFHVHVAARVIEACRAGMATWTPAASVARQLRTVLVHRVTAARHVAAAHGEQRPVRPLADRRLPTAAMASVARRTAAAHTPTRHAAPHRFGPAAATTIWRTRVSMVERVVHDTPRSTRSRLRPPVPRVTADMRPHLVPLVLRPLVRRASPDAAIEQAPVERVRASRQPELHWRRPARPDGMVPEPAVRQMPASFAPLAMTMPTSQPRARSFEADDPQPARPVQLTDLDPRLVDRLTDDVIRRVERRVRIERERRGL